MDPDLAQALVVPLCFALAGVIGLRLGTPGSVGAALLAVGVAHVMAVAVSALLGSGAGPVPALVHVLSQVLFVGGLVGLLWIAAVFPRGGAPRPARRLAGAGLLLAVLGPMVGAVSGPTPSVFDATGDGVERGPVVEVLPSGLTALAAAPMLLLPAATVVTFVVRATRADAQTRRAMAWPVVGIAVVALLVIAGSTLGDRYPAAGDVAFLCAAPLVPLAIAFGPIRDRLTSLSHQTARLSADLAERVAELEESRHRLATAAEAERQRIERDLHDGAQQEILAMMAHMEIARATADPAQREQALQRASDLGRGAYETVRRIARGVRPAELDDLGLTESVRGLVAGLPLPSELDLDETHPGDHPPAVEGAALLFVSECVANVLKHAGAQRVLIRLRSRDGALHVAVQDDGVGGVRRDGAGLRGLADRVEAAGGRLRIASDAGGSLVEAVFPAGSGHG